MRAFLVAMGAALLAAGAASGATLSLDLDKSTYQPGDDVVITATLDLDGSEVLGVFGYMDLSVSWNPSLLSVKNAGVLYPEGNGSQLITAGPGIGGSALTGAGGTVSATGPASSECDVSGYQCRFLHQFNPMFGSISLDAQTLVATLVLNVEGSGNADLSVSELYFFGNSLADPALIQYGANWSALAIPEPASGSLLALGLVGIAQARRRLRSL